MKNHRPLFLGIILGSLWGSGCATLDSRALEQQVLTSDQRVMTETQAAEIVDQLFKDKKIAYQNTAQDARISAILSRLSQAAGSGVPFQARLYQDREANAFSIGGKYVFVSSAFLSQFPDDPNLLAGVLGHEIAHDIAGHHQRQQTEAYWRSVATHLALKLGKDRPQLVSPVAQSVSALMGLHFSRSQEKEADILGTVYASRAGYNPEGLLQFFEKTSNALSTNRYVSYLSTHPYHPARIATIQLVSRYLKGELTLEQVRVTDPQTARVLQSLQKIDIRRKTVAVAPSSL